MRLIKFEKNGCMPCRKMDSILKKLNVEYEHFNIDEEENADEEVAKYGIISTPTLIKITENGVEKLNGVQYTTDEFKKFCEIK